MALCKTDPELNFGDESLLLVSMRNNGWESHRSREKFLSELIPVSRRARHLINWFYFASNIISLFDMALRKLIIKYTSID